MKKLEDLKDELIQDKLCKFYVFYGEDYGIRKHYVEKIKSYFTSVKTVDSYEAVSVASKSKSLFKEENLYIIYGDEVFADLKEDVIAGFIKNLVDHTCIMIYEEPLTNTTLFKQFQNYITYFPVVELKVAEEFVDSELQLAKKASNDLAFNCGCNYNNILLESDKIRNYAQTSGLSLQNAYESLERKSQLLENYEAFNSGEFMNDVLTGSFSIMEFWTTVIARDVNKFYFSLSFMVNDFIIAGLLTMYGKWDGSNKAFAYGLNWGRVKEIRELEINLPPDYLFDCADRLAKVDMLVKTGKLQRTDLFDYFLTNVI
jgi:hypothetical protein